MRISSSENSVFSFNFSNSSPQEVSSKPVSKISIRGTEQAQNLQTLATLRQLQGELDEFKGPLRSSTTTGRTKTTSTTSYTAASVSSSQTLDLSVTPATAARLESESEINSTPTSFSTRAPEFSGDSSSIATVGGTYDGSNETQTLSFNIEEETNGLLDLQTTTNLVVRDNQGVTIDQFNLDDYERDSTLSLANGLTVQLSDGSLEDGSSFNVTVFDSVGSVVNPENSFNGTRDLDPNFEEGTTVTEGSFQLNGETILVASNDSINSVIGKINTSAANVTGTFNQETERIEVVQNTPGAQPLIIFLNDTSGFLAATKLLNGDTTAGTDEIDELNSPLEQVARFSAVQNGYLRISGVSIAVNVRTDSLSQILERISSSAAEVDAEFDPETQRVKLESRLSDQTLTIEDQSTNLLEAIKIASQTIEPESETIETTTSTRATSGVAQASRKSFLDQLERTIDVLNKLFDDDRLFDSASAFTTESRNAIQEVIASFNSTEQASSDAKGLSDFGLKIDFDKTQGNTFNFSSSGRDVLNRQLRSSPTEINALLFGTKSTETEGLFDQLGSVIETLEKDLLSDSTSGTLVNFLA